NQMFILGTGFVGKFFAADLKNKGWAVSGSCTSLSSKEKLQELGYPAYVFNAEDPQSEVLEVIKNHTHLLVSIPPLVGFGDPLLHHKELVTTILKDGNLQWLLYLSSTSMFFCVYGDCGGKLVDEDYPVEPATDLARARLAAEQQWLSLGTCLDISAQVFRLGGIYGPGRSAVDTLLKKEKPVKMRPFKTYVSRIHVADICQAINASISKASDGLEKSRIYNVVDDDPASRMQVLEFARRMVGEESSMKEEQRWWSKKSSGEGEKRVSNGRMKEELGVKLVHPSYRSGLRSIMD
ncbi:hypothetical protein M569_11237, partial [Genlisea aurea]